MKKRILTAAAVLIMATGAWAVDPGVIQILQAGCNNNNPKIIATPPCSDQPAGLARNVCEMSYIESISKRAAQDYGQFTSTALSVHFGVQKQADWATITRNWMKVEQAVNGNAQQSNTLLWLASHPLFVKADGSGYDPYGYLYIRAKNGSMSVYGIASLLDWVQTEGVKNMTTPPYKIEPWKSFARAFYTGDSDAVLKLVTKYDQTANAGAFGGAFAKACKGF